MIGSYRFFFLSNTFFFSLSLLALRCGASFILQQAATVGGATPLELQTMEKLRLTMAGVLELSINNLGESLPMGNTWEELSQEIHKGSESKQGTPYSFYNWTYESSGSKESNPTCSSHYYAVEVPPSPSGTLWNIDHSFYKGSGTLCNIDPCLSCSTS